MKNYKMVWGDVLRMQGDFAFPPETFDSIEFAPAKEMYEEFGNPVMLRKAVIGSFLASSKKLSVRKWVIEELDGLLPIYFESVKQSKGRWNIDFIKIEEEVKKVKKVKKVEVIEEVELILEEEKESKTWQQ